jgi:DNA-binding LacI/PurR family transcriptional regulator
MPTVGANLGHRADAAANLLRAAIVSGRMRVGSLLPSVRALAAKHSLDTKTLWRALKGLESERLIAAEPGRGFRVLPGANDPLAGCPVGLVFGDPGTLERTQTEGSPLLGLLSSAATDRGLSAVAFRTEPGNTAQLLEQLRSVRAFGVVTDSFEPQVVGAFRAAGFPVVMFDMSMEAPGVDAVMQDGYRGGLLAARHLLGRGKKRIAWFGDDWQTPHRLDRYAGVAAGLFEAGREMLPALRMEGGSADCLEKAKRLLSRKDRPDAVIVLWSYLALAVKRAADELGLVVGRDFEMVGWSSAESYATHFRPAFGAGPVPPCVIWSAKTMAEMALSRLLERRANPGLEPVTVRIPTKLLLDGE